MVNLRKVVGVAVVAWLMALTSVAQGATVVAVQTNLGSFKIELFEHLAPNAVSRFLADVEAGVYHFTFLHFASPTLIAGGQYRYNSCPEGPVRAAPDTLIPAETTGLRNTVRRVALVRDAENPELLTQEWLINLGTNASPSPAVEPVVIGEVIEGLDLLNLISILWRVPIDPLPAVPTRNYEGIIAPVCGFFSGDNLISVAMAVESVDSLDPANVFDPQTGLLRLRIDAHSLGLVEVQFAIEQSGTETVIRALPETLNNLTGPGEGMAVFVPETGVLTIPTLSIEGELAFRDLILTLTDPESIRFSLDSYEPVQ